MFLSEPKKQNRCPKTCTKVPPADALLETTFTALNTVFGSADCMGKSEGDANRQISDLKFKLAKSEQEITALEQNVIRLESQVSRYKLAAENAEKIEDELKAEKRKLQRELRSALDKTEELEVSNGHLVKRLEKMKANRSVLLSQQ
eukprot:bmy_18837T0